jgi:gentisate 1,2-dioxygenase
MPTLHDPMADLYQAAAAEHAQPLWPILGELSPPQPVPKATPHVWSYERLRPSCVEAGRLVGAELAERRVLILVNPTLSGPFTTDTLYAGLQTILPGEVARAHRHTAFALRFIIEGRGGYTAVEGEKVVMEPGDLVLTPQMEWHDHGNEGDAPVIWMDGLDLALWKTIPALFTDHYPESRFPSTIATGPSVRRYPWAEMQPALDAAHGPSAEIRYAHRETGGDISATIGAAALRIDAGYTTPVVRETASSVFHVYSGSGHSQVGDVTLEWRAGDCFAVPSWQHVRHTAAEADGAYLFRMDDRPLLTALGAYRIEG